MNMLINKKIIQFHLGMPGLPGLAPAGSNLQGMGQGMSPPGRSRGLPVLKPQGNKNKGVREPEMKLIFFSSEATL